MTSQRTDKSKYPSRYSPQGWVTAAQYIIELVCEQRARFDKKDLPVKFWNLPEWEKFYKSQLRACHRLLKQYDERAIINVIKEKKIRTLMPKWIEPVIAQEHKNIQAKKSQRTTKQKSVEKPIITKQSRPKRNLKRGVSNLLALDDEE